MDTASSSFHVLEQNAHAWPEVYFPNYGWVEFEPTASESPIIRPAHAAAATPDPNATATPDDTLSNKDKLNRAEQNAQNAATPTPPGTFLGNLIARIPLQAVAIGAGTVLAALVVLGLLSIRMGVFGWENLGRPGRWVLRRRGLLVPSAIGLVYLQLERAARWLGISSSNSVTPFERAAAFTQLLPDTGPAVNTITNEYVAERYSPRAADASLAEQAWHGVRFQIWHDALRSFLLDVLEEDPPLEMPK